MTSHVCIPAVILDRSLKFATTKMGLANLAKLSNSFGAECHMDMANPIQAIQKNWFIQTSPEAEDILPASLLAGVPVDCLPTGIIEAVYELSRLTIGQRDRAHNLLNTYFQARIREDSCSGKSPNIFAILEIGDVEKACDSLRRMSRGREMQGPVPIKKDETTKRKYSIRQEFNADDDDDDKDGARLAKRLKKELCVIPEDDNEPTTPPSLNLHCMPTPPDSEATIALPTIQSTPRTQRRAHLPPICTTQIEIPTAFSPQNNPPHSSFTPLFNSLKHEFGGDPDSPCPIRPSTTFQQLENSNTSSNIWDNYIGDRYEAPRIDPRVQAAQRATHEFNVRWMEVVEAQRAFEEARRRLSEAKRRMLGARGRCGWR